MSRFTWVHTKVNQVIPSTDATPEKTLFFKIVDSLLTVPGAAIVKSCDSTTTSATNLITGASAVVYASGAVAHSWAQISFANGGQIMISANDQYATPGISTLWSPAAGFTGGTTTVDPTATDQLDATFYSTGMDLSGTKPWVYHAMWTTDGLRFHGTLFAGGAHLKGVLSMMYIDDPAATAVSTSPRGFLFQGDGWDMYSTSLAYVGKINTTGIAMLPISSGLVNTRKAHPTTLRSVAGQFSDNVLDRRWPFYSIDAFADSTVAGTGTKIVGRLGALADMYIASQDVASDNNGLGVHAPSIAVLPTGERWAVFGGVDADTAVALPWDSSNFLVYGNSSDATTTATVNGEIIDVEVAGTSPLSTYTWNGALNQAVSNLVTNPCGTVVYNLIQSLLTVPGATLTGSNAIASGATVLGDGGVASVGHSWATIKFANGGEILITMHSFSATNPTGFNVAWSPSGLFSGGTANFDPTAPDELYPANYGFGWSNMNSKSVLHVLWSSDGKRIRAAFMSGGGAGEAGFCNGALSIEVLENPIGAAATAPLGFCAFNSGWAQGGRPSDGMRWLGIIAGNKVVLQAVSGGISDFNLSGKFPAANVGDPNHFGGFGRVATVIGPEPLYVMWGFCDGSGAGDVGFGSPSVIQSPVHGFVGRFADMYTSDGYLTANAAGSDTTVFPTIALLDNGERWSVFSGNNDYSATALKWDTSDQKTIGDGTDPTPTPTIAAVIVDPAGPPPTPPATVKAFTAQRVNVPNSLTTPVVVSADFDPTGAGVSAPVGSLCLRTDVPSTYSKTGTADNAWTLHAFPVTSIFETQFFDDLTTVGEATFQVLVNGGSAVAGLTDPNSASHASEYVGCGMLQVAANSDDTVLYAGSGLILANLASADSWSIVARLEGRDSTGSTGQAAQVLFGIDDTLGSMVAFGASPNTFANSNWWAVVGGTHIDTNVAVASNAAPQVLRIDYDGASNAIVWSINGTVVASTNLAVTGNWRPCVRHTAVNVANVSNQCFIDYIGWKLVKASRS